MSRRKDGMPKVTPDLASEEVFTNPPKVWITNYEIRLNGVHLRNSLMVPRGISREQYRDTVGKAMSMDLAKVINEMFSD